VLLQWWWVLLQQKRRDSGVPGGGKTHNKKESGKRSHYCHYHRRSLRLLSACMLQEDFVAELSDCCCSCKSCYLPLLTNAFLLTNFLFPSLL
jgi:hypothetical protein